jgi:trigger factor
MSHSHHDHSVDYKTAFTVTPGEHSTVTIAGELPYEELQAERPAALKALGADIAIDGFRKGHVPEAMLVKHLGEMRILGEIAERAIAHAYPHILEVHNIDAIGRPDIQVTKIAPGNPLGFTATVAVLPTFTLPNYESIAKEHNKDRASDAVTDAEVEEKIEDILRQKAAYERLQKKAAAAPADGELPTPESEAAKADTEGELVIPELTDEVAQALGKPGQFADVADLKAKLREHLEIEKKRDNAAAHRAKVTDAIIAVTDITVPHVLIESEINQMFAQMKDDLGRANLSFDDYLTHIKKTREELIAEWTPAAEKRAKLQLVLNEIAKQQHISPDPAQMQSEVDGLLKRFPDADEHRVRLYVASVLTNEAVMKYLEELQ